ncbi:MAG: radical SAM protein [Lachnospiraceae bacterium]|nr:radical SAM protein [Lachnospiraceae bacterium]
MVHIKWEVTNLCNLNCEYCSNALSNSRYEELKEKEIGKNWNKVFEYFDNNISQLDLLGGEPLLYPAIIEVVKEASSRNIYTTVVTNGQCDITIGEKLLDAGLSKITISLEGLSDTHDSIRGTGTWKKAYNFLNELFTYNQQNSLSTELGINVVLTKKNAAEIPALIELLKPLDITIQITHLVEKGNATVNRSNLSLSTEEAVSAYDSIAQNINCRNNKIVLVNATPVIIEYLNYRYNLSLEYHSDICNAGSTLFSLDAVGNIFGCNLLKKETDTKYNIFTSSFLQMSKDQGLQIAFAHREFEDGCGQCNYYGICNPCPYQKSKAKNPLCTAFESKFVEALNNSQKKYYHDEQTIPCGTNNTYEKVWYPKQEEFVEYEATGAAILKLLESEHKADEMASITHFDKTAIEYFLSSEKRANHIKERDISVE